MTSARLLAAAFAGLAIGLLVGRTSPSDVAGAPPGDGAVRAGPSPAEIVGAPADCAHVEARVVETERRLEACESGRRELEEKATGRPLAWSGDVPEALSPEGFAAVARGVVERCAPGSRFLGTDCDEPPCFALFRVEGEASRDAIANCAAWFDHFDEEPLAWRFRSTCDEGAEEEFVVALGARDALAHVDEPKPKTRLRHRSTLLREEWRCKGGG